MDITFRVLKTHSVVAFPNILGSHNDNETNIIHVYLDKVGIVFSKVIIYFEKPSGEIYKTQELSVDDMQKATYEIEYSVLDEIGTVKVSITAITADQKTFSSDIREFQVLENVSDNEAGFIPNLIKTLEQENERLVEENSLLADTKVDKKGLSIEEHAGFWYVYKIGEDGKRTGQYVRMRGDIFEAFFKSDVAQVQGQYTINGPELYRKEFDENGNVTKSFNTKYHRDCIEGNNDAGKYFKLYIPRVAGTKTIATTADIAAQIADNYDPLKANVDKLQRELNSTKTLLNSTVNQLNDSSKRTGDWYSGETMKKGINLSIGRMYVCTGVGVKLVTSSGDELFDTNGETITPDGAKVVAVIMPNQVSYPYGHTEYAAYRCKAIWGSSSLFGSNFEAKDFLLETYDSGIKAVAEGGTSIWSM